MGDVQSRLGARVRGLVPGTTYYWSVQSVDTAFAGSTFAAEGSFIALADPPQNISFARDAGGVIHATWRAGFDVSRGCFARPARLDAGNHTRGRGGHWRV